MKTDREILFLRKIVALLESLSTLERDRCMDWLIQRFSPEKVGP
jgi:hypothetical protein